MRGAEKVGLSFFEDFLVFGLSYCHTVSPPFTVGTHTRGVQYYSSQEAPDRIERHSHHGPWTHEYLNVVKCQSYSVCCFVLWFNFIYG